MPSDPIKKKIYYKEHREEIKEKALKRHNQNKQSENYRKLHSLRTCKVRLKDRIINYQKKVYNSKIKLKEIERQIEIYELRWGKERSLRKHGNILARKDINT